MFLPDKHTLATGGSGPREASSDVARISNRWHSRALLRPGASVSHIAHFLVLLAFIFSRSVQKSTEFAARP